MIALDGAGGAIYLIGGGSIDLQDESPIWVRSYTYDGRLLVEWELFTPVRDGDNRISSPAIAGDRLHIVIRNHLRQYTLDGELVGDLDLTTLPAAADMDIQALTVDAEGFIYLTDATHWHVLKLSPGGHLVTAWSTRDVYGGRLFSTPRDIAVGADGRVYVINGRFTVPVYALTP
jgi:hypothetical protein